MEPQEVRNMLYGFVERALAKFLVDAGYIDEETTH